MKEITFVLGLNKQELKYEKAYLEDMSILDALRVKNFYLFSPCGGNHICKKCVIKVRMGKETKIVLACQTQIQDKMLIYVPNQQEVTSSKKSENECNLCLDLGTTTLMFYLVDKINNEIVYKGSFLNPQSSYGSDVISRIQYSIDNGVDKLFKTINDKTQNVLSFLKGYKIDKLFVCGNPTMLHLFIGKSVETLGKYPYKALFLKKKILNGSDLNLLVNKVILLPSFSSFVGSDISCGFIKTELSNGNNVLLDLGTNGEIVLSYKNNIFVTSTAAGPAFEGAGIECGCGGIVGAISNVIYNDNNFIFQTIGDASPIGLTGSALIDVIYLMKKNKIINSSGAFLKKRKKFYLDDKIYLTQKDIRNFQLAKSSIRTGIDILFSISGIKYKEINKFYIAGGFGCYLNIQSAIGIGLLPKSLDKKYVNVGNAAGYGAVEVSINPKKLKEMEKITTSAIVIDLNKQEDFLDKFAENIKL